MKCILLQLHKMNFQCTIIKELTQGTIFVSSSQKVRPPWCSSSASLQALPALNFYR